MTDNQLSFFKWFRTFLKDSGLQFSRSGFKLGDGYGSHQFDPATGFWTNVQHSAGKPPRWIFIVEPHPGGATASLPGSEEETGIGQSNTAQGDKAGLVVRILPVIKIDDSNFATLDDFEINALFVFNGGLPAGSSSDAFSFNIKTGALSRSGAQQQYIFAGLLGLKDRADLPEWEGFSEYPDVNYGTVFDSVRHAISISAGGEDPSEIAAYDLTSDDELARLKADLLSAWNDAEPLTHQAHSTGSETSDDGGSETLDFSKLVVPENPDLLGVDPAVYRQINAMLKSGKQHIMLYGPPGTGKTSLARWIGSSLPGGNWTLVTGSSDWSSQDIIGGYQPMGKGEVDFVPGILLRTFDIPLIIDELNRCDIDKVIGPLFTVLSGQHTTLPYRTDIADKSSPAYVILPTPKASAAEHEFAPGPGWRLIATINSIDKASLYQMSYALSRRFGWVYVDAPKDTRKFISDYLSKTVEGFVPPTASDQCSFCDLWTAINKVRPMGPAPFIDAIRAVKALDPDAAFFGPPSDSMKRAALDAFDMVLLPMLDGIGFQESQDIAEAAIVAFDFGEIQMAQIRQRLQSVAN
jgi:5-methylcytosine-specific restriction protein B